jgi:hypothetical protein
MLNSKVSRISIIEYIGGSTCIDNGVCKGEGDVDKPLRETYFYRKGTYIPSSLPSYTVHIPEKAILRK